jgi:hypothetical protein
MGVVGAAAHIAVTERLNYAEGMPNLVMVRKASLPLALRSPNFLLR